MSHRTPPRLAVITTAAAWIQGIIAADLVAPSKPPVSHAPSAAAALPSSPVSSSPAYWILVPAGVLVAALGLAIAWTRAGRRRVSRRRRRGAPG